MNKRIVFIAPYPTEKTIGEGMMQRIKNIDNSFKADNRTYLNIRLVKGRQKEQFQDGNLTVLRVNLFLHFNLILQKVKEADILYIHSVYNALPALPFLKHVQKKTKVVLDVHGVVPEELEFSNEKKKSLLFSFVERKAVKYIDTFIYVTNKMKEYYQQKYPFISAKEHHVYSIKPNMPATLTPSVLEGIKSELGLTRTDIVFIYSGSAQKWQNLELMFSSIKKLKNENYKFIILSGEPDAVKEVAQSVGYESTQIMYRSVSPAMLGYYYALSDYGFILRDDHILNRVASPTKLVEYLYFGITPIVKLEEIGDFNDLGYEYLSYKDLHNALPKRQSQKNRDVASSLLSDPVQINEKLISQ